MGYLKVALYSFTTRKAHSLIWDSALSIHSAEISSFLFHRGPIQNDPCRQSVWLLKAHFVLFHRGALPHREGAFMDIEFCLVNSLLWYLQTIFRLFDQITIKNPPDSIQDIKVLHRIIKKVRRENSLQVFGVRPDVN